MLNTCRGGSPAVAPAFLPHAHPAEATPQPVQQGFISVKPNSRAENPDIPPLAGNTYCEAGADKNRSVGEAATRYRLTKDSQFSQKLKTTTTT